jgi:hypothetical protein
MPRFWLAYDIDGRRVIYVQEGNTMHFAQLALIQAGEPVSLETFVEGHALPPATEQKVPKTCAGGRSESAMRRSCSS